MSEAENELIRMVVRMTINFSQADVTQPWRTAEDRRRHSNSDSVNWQTLCTLQIICIV